MTIPTDEQRTGEMTEIVEQLHPGLEGAVIDPSIEEHAVIDPSIEEHAAVEVVFEGDEISDAVAIPVRCIDAGTTKLGESGVVTGKFGVVAGEPIPRSPANGGRMCPSFA